MRILIAAAALAALLAACQSLPPYRDFPASWAAGANGAAP